MIESSRDEAVEVIGGRSERVVLTCEHASEALLEGWSWPAADARLAGTHWAFDIGAEPLTRELARALDAAAALARFSRLLADPNRDEASETLFRAHAEGAPVALNAAIDERERERRLARAWRPFHSAVDRMVAAVPAEIVLAVHTFTPIYEGVRRELELGVLFDDEDALAAHLVEGLAARDYRVAPNEPYSGKAGLIYVADRHAKQHGRRAIEIEVRQDLASDAAFRARLVAELTALLRVA